MASATGAPVLGLVLGCSPSASSDAGEAKREHEGSAEANARVEEAAAAEPTVEAEPEVERGPPLVLEPETEWRTPPECELSVRVRISLQEDGWSVSSLLRNHSERPRELLLLRHCPGSSPNYHGFPVDYAHDDPARNYCGKIPAAGELDLAPGQELVLNERRLDLEEIMQFEPARYEITASLRLLERATTKKIPSDIRFPPTDYLEVCAGPPAVFELRRVPSPGSACDLSRLELGMTTQFRNFPYDHRAQVARTLLNACPHDRFGPWQLQYLRAECGRHGGEPLALGDAERASLWASVCAPTELEQLEQLDPYTPAKERRLQAYDRCGWASRGLVTREEMQGEDVASGAVWAFAPLLEQLGIPERLSKPCMRTLILDEYLTLDTN